ncbi:hypothetical protein FI667_g9386, partial [Globisporangium splendens]
MVVHDPAAEAFVPAFYILCTPQSEDTHWDIIHFIFQAPDQKLTPADFVVDFEKGLTNAVQTQFPTATDVGCIFHFKQALRRKCKKCGIPGAEVTIPMKSGVLEMLTVVHRDQLAMDNGHANPPAVLWVKCKIKTLCQEKGIDCSREKWRIFWRFPNLVFDIFGNPPGPGGSGWALIFLNERSNRWELKACGYAYMGPEVTNNWCEYSALKDGLAYSAHYLQHCEVKLEVFGDSQTIIAAQNGFSSIRQTKLQPLAVRVNQIIANFAWTSWNHTKREQNKMADLLANMAMISKSAKILTVEPRGNDQVLLSQIAALLGNDIGAIPSKLRNISLTPHYYPLSATTTPRSTRPPADCGHHTAQHKTPAVCDHHTAQHKTPAVCDHHTAQHKTPVIEPTGSVTRDVIEASKRDVHQCK